MRQSVQEADRLGALLRANQRQVDPIQTLVRDSHKLERPADGRQVAVDLRLNIAARPMDAVGTEVQIAGGGCHKPHYTLRAGLSRTKEDAGDQCPAAAQGELDRKSV